MVLSGCDLSPAAETIPEPTPVKISTSDSDAKSGRLEINRTSSAVCQRNDRRRRVPVWTPEIDSDGNLSSEPPQEDGQIVYIELVENNDSVSCDDEALNSFSWPNEPGDPMMGGLAVNLRGNTQFANGMCYFRGYYMNEPVMGMHQGWIETYFGAVDKQKIVLSGDFCLERTVD